MPCKHHTLYLLDYTLVIYSVLILFIATRLRKLSASITMAITTTTTDEKAVILRVTEIATIQPNTTIPLLVIVPTDNATVLGTSISVLSGKVYVPAIIPTTTSRYATTSEKPIFVPFLPFPPSTPQPTGMSSPREAGFPATFSPSSLRKILHW